MHPVEAKWTNLRIPLESTGAQRTAAIHSFAMSPKHGWTHGCCQDLPQVVPKLLSAAHAPVCSSMGPTKQTVPETEGVCRELESSCSARDMLFPEHCSHQPPTEPHTPHGPRLPGSEMLPEQMYHYTHIIHVQTHTVQTPTHTPKRITYAHFQACSSV